VTEALHAEVAGRVLHQSYMAQTPVAFFASRISISGMWP
jgi:hypothetical protein